MINKKEESQSPTDGGKARREGVVVELYNDNGAFLFHAGVRSSIKREGDDEYFSCFVAVVIALSLPPQSCHVSPVVELTGCEGG